MQLWFLNIQTYFVTQHSSLTTHVTWKMKIQKLTLRLVQYVLWFHCVGIFAFMHNNFKEISCSCLSISVDFQANDLSTAWAIFIIFFISVDYFIIVSFLWVTFDIVYYSTVSFIWHVTSKWTDERKAWQLVLCCVMVLLDVHCTEGYGCQLSSLRLDS